MLLLAVACLAVSIALWRPAAAGPLKRPSALGVAVLASIPMAVLPAVLLSQDESLPATETHLAAVLVSIPALLMGGVVANLVSGRRTSADPWRQRRDLPKAEQQRLIAFIRIGAAATFILLLGLFLLIKAIPILSLIGGSDLSEVKEQRASSSSAGTAFALARLFFVPFLAALVAASWSYLKARRARLLGAFTLTLSFVYQTYTSRKTPVVTLLLALFVVAVFHSAGLRSFARSFRNRSARRRARWTRIAALTLVVGMIGYPIAVFSLKPYGQTSSIREVIAGGLAARAVTKPAQNTYYAFEMFPKALPFTLGSDIPLVASLTGKQLVDLSSLIAVRQGLRPEVNSPPTSVGAFWAEAGWLGIILGSVLAGLIYTMLDRSVRRLAGHPVGIALMAMLYWGAIRFSMGYFHAILLTETVVPALLVLISWKLWAGKRARPIRDVAQTGVRRVEPVS